MRYSNFGSFGNMHIRNGLLGKPTRNGFPIFSFLIILALLSSAFRAPMTRSEKDQDYERQLEIWRAHPEFVAYPIRSK